MIDLEHANKEIARRKANGRLLAKKFPELKGLGWFEFTQKLPIELVELDYITAREMWETLKDGGM